MSHFSYLTKKEKRTGKNKKKFTLKMQPKNIHLTLGSLIMVAIVSYLVQSNSIATKGYEIKKLEGRLAEVQLETRELQARSLELQSTHKVAKKVEMLEMEAAKNIEYITVDAKVVAR